MTLRLYFNGGKHMIRHEYHTYETYSFIADIGGYLVFKPLERASTKVHAFLYFQGLCLGASLLTFYDLAIEILSRAMKSRAIRLIVLQFFPPKN